MHRSNSLQTPTHQTCTKITETEWYTYSFFNEDSALIRMKMTRYKQWVEVHFYCLSVRPPISFISSSLSVRFFSVFHLFVPTAFLSSFLLCFIRSFLLSSAFLSTVLYVFVCCFSFLSFLCLTLIPSLFI